MTRTTLRLELCRRITSALEEINPENGYINDLRPDEEGRPRVVRGRLHFGDSDPKTMVTIMEPPMPDVPLSTRNQPDNPNRKIDFDLLIQGWTRDDPVNPTDPTYILVAEVQQRLAQEKLKPSVRSGHFGLFGFGSEVMSMEIGPPVIRPNEFISEEGVFFFSLKFNIAENVSKPFLEGV